MFRSEKWCRLRYQTCTAAATRVTTTTMATRAVAPGRFVEVASVTRYNLAPGTRCRGPVPSRMDGPHRPGARPVCPGAGRVRPVDGPRKQQARASPGRGDGAGGTRPP